MIRLNGTNYRLAQYGETGYPKRNVPQGSLDYAKGVQGHQFRAGTRPSETIQVGALATIPSMKTSTFSAEYTIRVLPGQMYCEVCAATGMQFQIRSLLSHDLEERRSEIHVENLGYFGEISDGGREIGRERVVPYMDEGVFDG